MLSKRIIAKQNACIKVFIEVDAHVNRFIVYYLNLEVNELTNYAAADTTKFYRVCSLYLQAESVNSQLIINNGDPHSRTYINLRVLKGSSRYIAGNTALNIYIAPINQRGNIKKLDRKPLFN